MRIRTDYKICPFCGASLDVGERCDCQQEQQAYKKISVCVYPNKYGCKGCEYNSVPELFDGGCILSKNKAYNKAKMSLYGGQAYTDTIKKQNALKRQIKPLK